LSWHQARAFNFKEKAPTRSTTFGAKQKLHETIRYIPLYHVSAEEDGKVVLQTADDRHPCKDAEQPHQHDQDGDDPAWAQVFPHCAATVQ
jgi:hypothetical protein